MPLHKSQLRAFCRKSAGGENGCVEEHPDVFNFIFDFMQFSSQRHVRLCLKTHVRRYVKVKPAGTELTKI